MVHQRGQDQVLSPRTGITDLAEILTFHQWQDLEEPSQLRNAHLAEQARTLMDEPDTPPLVRQQAARELLAHVRALATWAHELEHEDPTAAYTSPQFIAVCRFVTEHLNFLSRWRSEECQPTSDSPVPEVRPQLRMPVMVPPDEPYMHLPVPTEPTCATGKESFIDLRPLAPQVRQYLRPTLATCTPEPFLHLPLRQEVHYALASVPWIDPQQCSQTQEWHVYCYGSYYPAKKPTPKREALPPTMGWSNIVVAQMRDGHLAYADVCGDHFPEPELYEYGARQPGADIAEAVAVLRAVEWLARVVFPLHVGTTKPRAVIHFDLICCCVEP